MGVPRGARPGGGLSGVFWRVVWGCGRLKRGPSHVILVAEGVCAPLVEGLHIAGQLLLAAALQRETPNAAGHRCAQPATWMFPALRAVLLLSAKTCDAWVLVYRKASMPAA